MDKLAAYVRKHAKMVIDDEGDKIYDLGEASFWIDPDGKTWIEAYTETYVPVQSFTFKKNKIEVKYGGVFIMSAPE